MNDYKTPRYGDLTTVKYQGVNLPVDDRFIITNTSDFLIPLDGPPEILPNQYSYKYTMYSISFFGFTKSISEKPAGYCLQIGDEWYVASSECRYCHVNILLAKYSKLGSVL